MSDSPAAVLVDVSGSFHSLLSGSFIQDGTPGLGVMAKDISGVAQYVQSDVSGAVQVGITDINGKRVDIGTDDDNKNHLLVRADFATGTILQVSPQPITRDPSSFVLQRLFRSGSSDMIVDAEITPFEFIYPTGSLDRDVLINELRVFMSADNINFDGASFGPISGLTNGVTISIFSSGTLAEVATIRINEDWGLVSSPGTVFYQNTGPSDSLGMSIPLPGIILQQGNIDYIRVTVNDDLTSVKFKFFQMEVQGVKQ